MKLSKSCIGREERSAVLRIMESEYFGMGTEVMNFEEELSEFMGRPVVCVVNGTAALQLALEGAGIGRGDEVLVPSLTYVASFQAISATGAIPIACDVDEKTCTLSLQSLAANLTASTKAVMPVHYAGGVGDLRGVYDFAHSNKLRVIEDAAHAFGSRFNGELIGGCGDIVCFSFDGIKNITSGEGGCISTADSNVLRNIKNARLLGVEGDTELRYAGKRSWDSDVARQGWRYHMSDLMAGIGRAQLRKHEVLFSARQRLACLYQEKLSNTSASLGQLPLNFKEVVPHIYPVILPSEVDRQLLREKLADLGVPTGVHYKPNHLYSFFSESIRTPLPVTERLYPRLLTLPLHPDLTYQDVDFISSVILESL